MNLKVRFFIFRNITLAGLLGALAVPAARAQLPVLPAMESFAYTNGAALTGQNGGTNWLGAWAATSAGGFTVGAGLSYPNMLTSSNGIQDNSGSQYGSTRQWFNYATPFTNGTKIWFAFLARYDLNHNSELSFLPFGITNSTMNGYGVTINCKDPVNGAAAGKPRVFIRANGTSYGISGSTSTSGLLGSETPGTTFLVVGRFVLSTSSNSDTLDVWVNPLTEPTNNSSLRLTGFTAARTASNSAGNLLIYSGYSSKGVVDEIGIGYTYPDATRNLAAIPVLGTASLTAALVPPTNRINLTWTTAITNATGLRLERSANGSGFSTLVEITPGMTNFSDTGLALATSYSYRIVATNNVGGFYYSGQATESTTPLPVTPIVPTFEFQKRKHGLFVHYVYGGWMGNYTALGYQAGYPTNIDQLVNSFNVTNFANQVSAMGVEYLILTAYHANMNVLFPSTNMAKWRGPGHATTSRDLLGEICDAMNGKGIKVHFYIHIDIGQDFSPEDKAATGYTNTDRTLWNSFMNEIVGEIGDRYGNRIEGFWCDGAYINSTALNGIKTAMRRTNPNLIVVGNNAQSFGSYDLGCKEAGSIASGEYSMLPDAPPGYPVTQSDVKSWLAYDRQIALVAGSGWWSSNGDTNSMRYQVDDLVKYTALQAGANTHGGGVAWSSGCFGHGSFDPDFLNKMTAAWNLMKPIAVSITNTIPSTSFITPKLASIQRLSGGFTATMSVDRHYDYIHVLRPPAGNTLQLPVPADGRSFNSAMVLVNSNPVTLATNEFGYLLTLPVEQSWDPRDTVIRLTAELPLPESVTLSPVADTRILNTGNANEFAGATDTMGVYQGRDRTFVRFDLSAIPSNAVINSATLTIYANTTYGSNPSLNPLEIHRVTRTWNEYASSWNYFNGVGNNWSTPGGDAVGTNGVLLAGPFSVNHSNPGANQPVNWDIKNLVSAWLNNTFTNQGLMVRQGGSANGGLHFWSREKAEAGLRPSLSITYRIPPVPVVVEPASSPNPVHGAINVAVTQSLHWTASANALSHQFYFGANSNAVATATTNSPEFQGTQAATSYAPGPLATSARYFWRVDEVGASSSTNGAIWTFATLVSPSHRPQITGNFGSGNYSVSFPSQIGQTYRMERTDSLSPTGWQVVSNNISGTGGPIQVPDLDASGAQGFYRVLIPSP